MAQAKARSQGLHMVSQVGGNDLSTGGIPCCLAGVHWRAGGIRSRARTEPGHSRVGCGDLKQLLISCSNAHPRQEISSIKGDMSWFLSKVTITEKLIIITIPYVTQNFFRPSLKLSEKNNHTYFLAVC